MIKKIIAKENPVIIEIGAHYGEDTLRFNEIFLDPTIYCFEPDPRNINIFKKYVKSSNVKLFEVALSNKKGTSNFYQSYQTFNAKSVPKKYDWISIEDYKLNKLNNSGSSSLKKGYKHILEEKIIVNTDTFDSYFCETKTIDFVWIDVQGAEKEVLEGMSNSMTNIKYIWIEYGETDYEGGMNRSNTIELLNEYGFCLVSNLSDTSRQGDLLFVNKDKIQK
jgi:FkbM family methyltransferase